MRKLVYSINMTIDGCVDHTKGIVDSEVHKFYADMLGNSDTFLYGRKTYELMVPYWPDVARNNSGEDQETINFAKAFDAVKKIVVFSRTLKNPGYKKATVVSSNLKEEVLKLKQEEGKDILTGGVDVPSQLIDLGLVDEFIFVVHPLVVGEGRRMLENYSLQQRYKLMDTKVFKSGIVSLHYKNS